MTSKEHSEHALKAAKFYIENSAKKMNGVPPILMVFIEKDGHGSTEFIPLNDFMSDNSNNSFLFLTMLPAAMLAISHNQQVTIRGTALITEMWIRKMEFDKDMPKEEIRRQAQQNVKSLPKTEGAQILIEIDDLKPTFIVYELNRNGDTVTLSDIGDGPSEVDESSRGLIFRNFKRLKNEL